MNINVSSREIQGATRGIVRGGETLKEHRDRLMEATKRTKCYAGLKKLELRDSQPILYNKLFSRLRAGVVDARETAKKIAASPIVEQEGELCFTLYNAAGDSILTSTGIIIHVGTMYHVINSDKVFGTHRNGRPASSVRSRRSASVLPQRFRLIAQQLRHDGRDRRFAEDSEREEPASQLAPRPAFLFGKPATFHGYRSCVRVRYRLIASDHGSPSLSRGATCSLGSSFAPNLRTKV
jgi:Hydantoinase B/oxoprolinase